MRNNKRHIQKKLLDKYSDFGFNQNGELDKLDAQLIEYLKEDLTKKNQEKQNRIKQLEQERKELKKPVDFDKEFIIKNFTFSK